VQVRTICAGENEEISLELWRKFAEKFEAVKYPELPERTAKVEEYAGTAAIPNKWSIENVSSVSTNKQAAASSVTRQVSSNSSCARRSFNHRA